MAKKTQTDTVDALDALRKDIAAGSPRRLYVFHGAERYLAEHYMRELRSLLCPGGTSDFNYRRYEGKGLRADELAAACETLPVFSARTLVEVRDYDIFGADEAERETLAALFDDLPDYVCLVFFYDVLEYAPDGRLKKLASALKKEASVVEFRAQEQSRLIKWIGRHFAEAGKTIDTPTAEYLAFTTGGLMTSLDTEIEKLSSYVRGETVTRGDIDAVVTPALDAVSWKLTDSIVGGRFDDAARILADLLSMQEPPHKLIYSITLKLRQLMAARVLLDRSLGEEDLMRICGMKFGFQARILLKSARSTTPERCARFVLLSADTAYRMNTGGDPESLLTELLIRLAACWKGGASC
jgi:DNA polymerase-3 subunit delta